MWTKQSRHDRLIELSLILSEEIYLLQANDVGEV
jgi:hypothetical protein